MIAVRMQGGLGNQLFQYAAGRALADGLGRDLALDLRDFGDHAWDRRLAGLPLVGRHLASGNTPRPYLLDRFHIRALKLPPRALRSAGFPSARRWRRLWRMAGLGRGVLVHEKDMAFLPGLSDAAQKGDPAYLDGYWQSWRYFQARRRGLLGDLRVRSAPSARNAALLRSLGRRNAVCVHVRRGDYATTPSALAFHGLLGADYYRAALKRLGAAARGATLYVFSDEPAWARRELRLPGKKVVVDHNSVDEPEEDLRLMAACRHFITANSSFSWWGAWMGENPGKRVVAPLRWFKAGPPVPDLCPPEWMRL